MRLSTWAFTQLAVALGIAGMLVGLGSSYLVKPQYVSRATMQMTLARIDEAPLAQDVIPQLNQTIRQLAAVLSRNKLAYVANQLNLYDVNHPTRPLEDVVEDMKRDIDIDLVALPGALGRRATAFNIIFAYPDRFKAQQTVRALMNAFEEQNQQIQRGMQGKSRGIVMDVLDTASLPVVPSRPNRYRMAGIGCIAGLIAAVVITLIGRARHAPSISLLAANQ